MNLLSLLLLGGENKDATADSGKIQLHMLFIYVFIVNITFATLTYYFFYGQITNAVTYLDHVYFATVSLATIGYGDMTPTTQKARMWVSSYLFIIYTLMLSLAL
jgi:hypothetical protein